MIRGTFNLVFVMLTVIELSNSVDTDTIGSTYANLLIERYGSHGVMSSSALDSLITEIACDTNSCTLKNSSAECLVCFSCSDLLSTPVKCLRNILNFMIVAFLMNFSSCLLFI